MLQAKDSSPPATACPFVDWIATTSSPPFPEGHLGSLQHFVFVVKYKQLLRQHFQHVGFLAPIVFGTLSYDPSASQGLRMPTTTAILNIPEIKLRF